jgi:hypothetical protein
VTITTSPSLSGALLIAVKKFQPGIFRQVKYPEPQRAIIRTCSPCPEFTGAHLCHASEYLLSRSAVSIPAAGAWLDGSATEADSALVLHGSTTYGRNTSYSCSSFTTTSNSYGGTYLQTSGAITWNSGVCASPRRIACCH